MDEAVELTACPNRLIDTLPYLFPGLCGVSKILSCDHLVLSTRTVAIGSSGWFGKAMSMPVAAFIILSGLFALSARRYAPATVRGNLSR